MRCDAKPRRKPTGPIRSRCVLLSLALHAPIGVAAVFAHALEKEPAPTVVWSVEASMLAHAAPPTAAIATAAPAVENEGDAPSEPPTLHDVELSDAPEAEAAPEPSTLLVKPTPAARKDALAQAIAASLPRATRATTADVEPEPTKDTTTTDATSPAPASAEDRPQVLSPLPGHNPRPDYPESARRRGIEGIVVVRIEVDEEGAAVGGAVAQSSGSVALDEAALRAARKWRFEDGPGSVDVPFRFAIESRAITARR